MKNTTRIVITLAVVAVAAPAFVARQSNRAQSGPRNESVVAASPAHSGTNARFATTQTAKLPRLLDFGAGKCIPCKMMAPILEGLRKEYEGRMEVVFIDVWENPDAGTPYGIEVIPTQIFYNAEGKELFRHSGFFGKEDILAKWNELGFPSETNRKSSGSHQPEKL
jgi:thioredoxin 1